MSKGLGDEIAPTMIIPRGTRIEMDPHGQLSIQAPGNLVIQNSGSYGTIESLGGSIRIDRGVEVEAVTVRCAETCYVQGSLTAWKVIARALHLEDAARANVVLQETQRLEVGRDARLVGNFSSERELFVLFSRFAQQVRSLPFFFDRRGPAGELPGGPPAAASAETMETAAPAPPGPEPAAAASVAPQPEEFPEPLLFALVLVERELDSGVHGPTSQRAMRQIAKLLQDRDFETLQHTWRTLFGRVVEPREDVRRARELVEGWFGPAAAG